MFWFGERKISLLGIFNDGGGERDKGKQGSGLPEGFSLEQMLRGDKRKRREG